jgi:hypothetical protein
MFELWKEGEPRCGKCRTERTARTHRLAAPRRAKRKGVFVCGRRDGRGTFYRAALIQHTSSRSRYQVPRETGSLEKYAERKRTGGRIRFRDDVPGAIDRSRGRRVPFLAMFRRRSRETRELSFAASRGMRSSGGVGQPEGREDGSAEQLTEKHLQSRAST